MSFRHFGLGPSILGFLSLTAAAASAQEAAAAHSGNVSYARANKVDLLFVVDNSASMSGEQRALTDQIPKLIESLTTGRRHPGDRRSFRPVTDLHVGVVSTDMGIPGVEFAPSCHADGGPDSGYCMQPRSRPSSAATANIRCTKAIRPLTATTR